MKSFKTRFVSSFLVVMVAFGLVVGHARPARAVSSHCVTTVNQLLDVASLEPELELSSQDWDALRELIPFLRECVSWSAAPVDDQNSDRSVSHPGMGTDVDQWHSIVSLYFAPEDVDRVMCLMTRESGGNASATNSRTRASGLMQVMPFWAEVFGLQTEDLYKPHVNLWVASQILDMQGWSAWSPYRRGSCR